MQRCFQKIDVVSTLDIFVDFHEGPAAGNDALVGLGVEAGSHGQAGNGQLVRHVTHCHEFVFQHLVNRRPFARIALKMNKTDVYTNSQY